MMSDMNWRDPKYRRNEGADYRGRTMSTLDEAREAPGYSLAAAKLFSLVSAIQDGKTDIMPRAYAAVYAIADIAREGARAVAEEVYAGKAMPEADAFERMTEAELMAGLDALMTPATSPTDTGAGEAWTEERLREHAKKHGWYIREGTSVPDLQSGGYRHPFHVSVSSRELVALLNTAVADLEQRLATVSENQDTAERERDAALASLEAMERRVGEAVEKLKWDLAHPEVMGHDRGEIIAVLTGEGPSPAALTPDAGEGK